MNNILEELKKLEKFKHTNKNRLKKLTDRAQKSSLTRSENPANHFCSFFVPIDVKQKKVFLVHHIKANDWIPPGGHIELNETTFETIKREMFEELQYKITNKKIELFDICIKPINNSSACKIHNDFWYLVHMSETDFVIDKREFYDAKWVDYKEGLKMMKTPEFSEIYKKLNIVFK